MICCCFQHLYRRISTYKLADLFRVVQKKGLRFHLFHWGSKFRCDRMSAERWSKNSNRWRTGARVGCYGCWLSWTHPDCCMKLRRCEMLVIVYERPPKPPTIRNSYTRTLIVDMIMKLSGTIGVTQKTMTFDIHVCLILNLKTFIQQVNIGMKSSLQEHPEAVCQK